MQGNETNFGKKNVTWVTCLIIHLVYYVRVFRNSNNDNEQVVPGNQFPRSIVCLKDGMCVKRCNV